jgi:two-component system alkaline phosphatase synthesis response regulator PhoP
MAKILVVEDEASIRRLLGYDLGQVGYEVELAENGEDGLNKALKNEYDVILLDLMLPKINGMDVCRELREHNISSYIIMLTAMSDEISKLEGLEIGADDYLTKPFSTREVIARIKSGLRRINMNTKEQKDNSDILEYKNIKVYSDKYEVFLDNEKIDLTLKELELLSYLIKNKGKALSRDVLLNKLWGFSYDGDTRIVDVHIFKLREKLNENAKSIKTVRGVGYMLEMEKK